MVGGWGRVGGAGGWGRDIMITGKRREKGRNGMIIASEWISAIYDTISQVSTGSIQMVAVQWTHSKFTVVLRMEAVPRALMPKSG